MPKPSINRETVPPGLLIVADVIARLPERKQDLLAYELKRRERELVMLRDTHQRLSWHPVQTLKSVILYGINAFVLAWSAGLLSSVGRSYASLKSSHVDVPIPFAQDFGINFGPFVPTSTPLLVAAQLPSVTLEEAIMFGLTIALAIILMRVIIVVIRWRKMHELHEQEIELVHEIDVLREWLTVDEAPKKA
jgi:hypothetical protein